MRLRSVPIEALGCLTTASKWARERAQLILTKEDPNNLSDSMQAFSLLHIWKKWDQILQIRPHPYLSYHPAFIAGTWEWEGEVKRVAYATCPSFWYLVFCYHTTLGLQNHGAKEQPGVLEKRNSGGTWPASPHSRASSLNESAREEVLDFKRADTQIFLLMCKVHFMNLRSVISGEDKPKRSLQDPAELTAPEGSFII